MKKYFMLALVILIGMASYCQHHLGDTRAEVIKDINAHHAYGEYHESTDSKGNQTIYVIDQYNEILKWFFSDGVVFEYHIIMDIGQANSYISTLNKTYAYDGNYQWSDYLTGKHVYYTFYKRTAYDDYEIVVSLKSFQ